ncbi:hypothetical protein FJTKL_05452 [Diaporthe vaccinii]|uniref:Uncharacterized protein n=1 Tax=Diaporthe vaccinii TaxID=105482 RepID=A0ABR4FFX5_9PEZI
MFRQYHPDLELCRSTTKSHNKRILCKSFFAFVSSPSSYRRLDIVKQPRGTWEDMECASIRRPSSQTRF